ncbi:unnamed protein product [Brachionus calyciflorus]|uniref:RRM domain-containing protein n=1 Tax=Brachionus calyciflorus TaxID=104777 RepID=A0A814AJ81_9BILA|nr:unnamed protein product [Brachionus calyciflorus]
MALICNCDLNEITGPSRDIFVTNVSIQKFGRRTGERFIIHMTDYILKNNLPWGPVHHAKVLLSKDSPNSTTKVMFLRFCNPECHADVIEDLNGIEWPVGLGRHLRMEFNRTFTQTHQLLSRERLQFKDMATQTNDGLAAKSIESDASVQSSQQIFSNKIQFGSLSTLSSFCYWSSNETLIDDDERSSEIAAKFTIKSFKNSGSIKKINSKLYRNALLISVHPHLRLESEESNNNTSQMPIKEFLSNQQVYDETSQKYKQLTDCVVDFITMSCQCELDKVLSLSVTTDCWTSESNHQFMGVTCHYVSQDNKLKQIPLCLDYMPKAHTSKNLASNLKSILSNYNIENKVASISTDSAANMIKMIDYLRGIEHFLCWGHIINTVVKNNLIESSNDKLKNVITKCRKLVGTFRHSSNLTEKLIQSIKKFENPDSKCESIYKLRQDVVTRWNSTFMMLESVLSKNINCKYRDQILNANELLLVEDLLELLKPFQHIAKLLSGSSYVTCSVVYPSIIRISEILIVYESIHGFGFLDDLAKDMYNDLIDRSENKNEENEDDQELFKLGTVYKKMNLENTSLDLRWDSSHWTYDGFCINERRPSNLANTVLNVTGFLMALMVQKICILKLFGSLIIFMEFQNIIIHRNIFEYKLDDDEANEEDEENTEDESNDDDKIKKCKK